VIYAPSEAREVAKSVHGVKLVDTNRSPAALPPTWLLALDDLQDEVLIALFAHNQRGHVIDLFRPPLAVAAIASCTDPEARAKLGYRIVKHFLADDAFVRALDLLHECHPYLAADDPFLLTLESSSCPRGWWRLRLNGNWSIWWRRRKFS
jgi:hypothetical protein